MIYWEPPFLRRAPVILDCPHSAWEGLDRGLAALLYEFCPGAHLAVEFGVEYGYSTVALSGYFYHVIGVDPLLQTDPPGFADRTRNWLSSRLNIELVREGWQYWADRNANIRADLIHIDIDPHNYPMTFAAGSWAAAHSDCVLFHDTCNGVHSEEVCRAVSDIAAEHDMQFYNWPKDQGLGILVRG